MNQDVTDYLARTKPWQQAVCATLRQTILDSVPDVEEVIQYGKPHFTVDGANKAVLHVAAAKVSFMVFDAGSIEAVPGVLRAMGNGDRKVIDLSEGDGVDTAFVADLLRRTSGVA